ncbi:galactoside alpha-(1,2)-fucosyltransferase 2 [Aplysia californica]|uniref:L-Fucosyltransferase n=1 Tax=Aplysia californica TaxID=6500 RepID=A0ABM0K541_APLCA|nr:galactoside alpha-(1,2)-fucosyltransferase 2 [Aplysia californica]
MRMRRGPRCYVVGGVVALVLLFLYVSDLTYISAFLNQKVPIHRPVIPWEDVKRKYNPSQPRLMISFKGRLGNHMFEYATLVGMAEKYNMTPIIPGSLDVLDVFNLPTPQGDSNLLRSPLEYNEEMTAKYSKVVETLNPKRDTYLVGYFQSWKYYNHIRQKLLDKYFVFHENIQKAAERYIANVLEERNKKGAVVVAIHVRRGDFVRQRVKGFTVAPIPYYYRAMAYFRKKFDNIMFIICTNDFVWAETYLDSGPDIHYSHETDGALDLAIMVNSNHIIITSGSYSWWAGYLVRGEVVYYAGYPKPNTIIGNQTVKADYYPPWWKPLL